MTLMPTKFFGKEIFHLRSLQKKGNSFLIFLAVVPLHGPASVKLESCYNSKMRIFCNERKQKKIGAKYICRTNDRK